MSAGEILRPLDRFVGCLTGTAVLLKPEGEVPRAQIQSLVEGHGGHVVSSTFGRSLHVLVPLRQVASLAESPLVGSLIYEGDTKGWGVHVTPATAKVDAYITRLLSFLAATPIMVQAPDGLQPQDSQIIEGLGGRIKADLSIVNSYSAEVPLERLSELASSPRVQRISYDTPLVPA